MSHNHLDERTIFLHAIEIASDQQRMAYLDEVCGRTGLLRDAVDNLLGAHESTQGLLDVPDAFCSAGSLSVIQGCGTSIGPYRLQEVIGEGGFGVVYLAEQTEPIRRQVAVKIIKPGMDTRQVIARFEAERQALALMDHPNIAKVLDGGATETGRPYFVMELVRGVPITDYCDRCQHDTQERLKLFAAVCLAVEHAHQKGIIHRDLKPTNVLVAMRDGRPAPKVIDFGVVKAIGQKLTAHTMRTQFAQMIGTPAYMSPEQAELSPIEIDVRSDIYSLGVLLYELLTGATPFAPERLSEASFDEFRRIIREEEPPRPSARVSTLAADASTTLAETRRIEPRHLVRQLRGELDWIVMKALAKDRTRRYESAHDLAADIERYLSNEPVQARPTSTLYRIRKFTSRNRLLVGSLTAVLVALTAGLAVATAGFLTAQKRLAEVTAEQEDNQALIELLSEIYGIPWGTEVYGQQHTVRQSLEKLSSGLDDRLRDHPKVEIEIRRIVARTYRKSREFDKARQHLQRALELAAQEHGRGVRYADILTEFADEIQWQRRGQFVDPTDLQAYAQQALEIYNQLGVETENTAHALFCLARSIEHDVKRHQEVEGYLRRALRIAQELAGADKDSSMQVFTLWDLAYHLAGKHEGGSAEANRLIEEAVQMSTRFNGAEHTVTASVIAERAACYRRASNVDGALASYQQAWEIYKKTGLENEPSGHHYAMMLAEIYHITHQHNKANEVLNELEQVCRKHEVWDSVAECLYLRGWGHLLREDYAAAESSLRESVELAEQHIGKQSEITAYARFQLALSLEGRGETTGAQSEYKQILPLTEYLAKSEHASEAALYGHAWAILRSGTTDTEELGQALAAAKRGLNRAAAQPYRGRESHCLLAVAVAQHRLGHRKQAVESLRAGLEKIRYPFPSLHAHHKDVPKSRRELEVTLAKYLVETEDFEGALKVYQEGIELRREQLGEGHLQVALAELRFGTFLLGRGQFDLAEEQLLRAHKQLSIDPQAADANRARAAAQLVELYTAWKKSEEAARWQVRKQGKST